MNESLTTSLLCLAALTKLHEYLQDKDLAGECMVRLNATVVSKLSNGEPDPRHMHIYFEFPIEYKNSCTQTYYPEAMEIVSGLDDITIELMPTIEAGNRYKSDGSDTVKCGLVFSMPAYRWMDACSYTFKQFSNEFVQLFNQHVASPILEIADDLFQAMHNLIKTFAEACNVEGPISDDPDDANYKLVK